MKSKAAPSIKSNPVPSTKSNPSVIGVSLQLFILGLFIGLEKFLATIAGAARKKTEADLVNGE